MKVRDLQASQFPIGRILSRAAYMQELAHQRTTRERRGSLLLPSQTQRVLLSPYRDCKAQDGQKNLAQARKCQCVHAECTDTPTRLEHWPWTTSGGCDLYAAQGCARSESSADGIAASGRSRSCLPVSGRGAHQPPPVETLRRTDTPYHSGVRKTNRNSLARPDPSKLALPGQSNRTKSSALASSVSTPEWPELSRPQA